MRNLKRALSLVLAAMMLIGMMVVGANAATKDFTDKDEIQNKEAVNVMVSLNVIAGKEDGSYFDPTGTLTRAEMAKLVTYVMNGGVEPVLGTKVTPTYSDIKGHWAEKYIEYCTSMGIIVGDGAGKFNPEGTLTASQCAKMLLTAMNYDANVFGFTGDSWEINTNREANSAGLYENLGGLSASAPISRDNACQMVYNAIQGTLMSRTWNQDMQTGDITEVYQPWTGHTLLTEKFNGNIYEGILVGTGKYNISVASKAGASTDGKFSFLKLKTNDGELYAPTSSDATIATMNCDDDLTDLMGQRVKVVAGKSGNIYGVFAMDAENTVINTVYGKLTAVDADTIKIDGTEYNISTGATLMLSESVNALSGYLPTTAVRSSAPVTAISYDGDGDIDLVLVTPISGANKVTYVSNTTFTAGTSYEKAKVIFPEELKKDDIVISYKNYFADKDEFEILQTVTGKVAASKGAEGAYTDVQVDGTWYSVAANVAGISSANNVSDAKVLARNSSYTLAIHNGYVLWSKLDVAGSKDIALVIGVAAGANVDRAWETKLLLADGTTKTVPAIDVTSESGATAKGSDKPIATFANINAGTTGGNVTTATNYSVRNASFVTYEINDNGVYELTQILSDSTADPNNTSNMAGYDNIAIASYGYDKDTKSLTNTNGSLGTKVDDTAVVFLQYVDNGVRKNKVISGAELNSMTNDFAANAIFLSNNTGLQAAQVVAISGAGMAPGVSATKSVGYVLTTPFTVTEGGTTYTQFNLWTENGLVENVKLKTGSVVKGDFISFDLDTDNFVTNMTKATETVAIVGYSDNAKSIRIANSGNSNYNGLNNLTDETKVIFVDSKNVAGIEGGEVSLATSPASGVYYSNAKVIWNAGADNSPGTADDEVEFICVDVANDKWDGATTTAISGAVTSATIKGLKDGMYTVDNVSGLTDTGSTGHNPAELRIFKFTAQGNAGETFTLTIKNSAGTSVYVETTGVMADTTGHFFVVNIEGNYNTSASTDNLSSNPGACTWEISGSTAGVVASGSITIS